MRSTPPRPSIPFLAIILTLFVLHALLLSHAQGFRVVDDAYISFRYLDRWLAGDGLVFNPGQRVEGYSNFLWLVLMAPFRALGIDPVRIAQGLGLLCGTITLWLTYRMAWHLTGAAWIGLCAALLLALDGSFARWAIDGLETHLFTLLVTLATWLEVTRSAGSSIRCNTILGLVLGLAALTRPEGVLVCGLLSLSRVYQAVRNAREPLERGAASTSRSSPDLRSPAGGMMAGLAWLWGAFALIVTPHLLWRLSYYGELVPNTAYVKVLPGVVATLRGAQYTVRFLSQRWGIVAGLAAVLILARLRARGQRRAYPEKGDGRRAGILDRLEPIPMVCLGMIAYVIVMGGDWMNRGRFFMPIAPLLAVWVCERVARALLPAGDTHPFDRRAALILSGMAILGGFGSSWKGELPWLRDAGLEHLERAAVVDWLRHHAGPADTLLTEEIGVIPYYTGLFTCLLYTSPSPRD